MHVRFGRGLLAAALVGAMVLGGVTYGVIESGAAGSGVTYFACLKAGKLTGVGTTAPTCPTGSQPISWDAQGPAGDPGAPGAQGPVGQASVVNVQPSVACPTPEAHTTASTTAAYLNVPSIPGESPVVSHANQIDVLSWSFGAAGASAGPGCAATSGPGGLGSGARDVTITKYVDMASPPLMVAAAAGTDLGTVTLYVDRKASNPRNLVTYAFAHAVVRTISWSNDDTLPRETVTFAYDGLTVTYQHSNPDGSLTPQSTCFDFVLQTPC